MMVVRCPECPDWFRSDDIMDHYEEQGINGPDTRVVDMAKNGGIYPYNSRMIRFRKPSKRIYKGRKKLESCGDFKVDEHGLVSMNIGTYNQLVGRWAPNLNPIEKGPFLTHLRRSWRPAVPLGVIAILLWHDCFPDLEGFIDDLRPMMYVWWN